MEAAVKAPTISIIVPVYHVEPYLAKCLDSILAQTMPDFELILINDGGTPEETGICEEYVAMDDRIVYRRQENQGLSAARNTGLELCRGKWIMFVDSDDWVMPDFCRKALQAVRDNNADLAVFDIMYAAGDDDNGKIHHSALPEGVCTGKEALAARLRADIAGYVWNKIYRHSLWDGIRFPVGENWEDDAVMHLLLDSAERVAVIHDVLYCKPTRSDNITSAAKRTFMDTRWMYLQRIKRYEYVAEHHPDLLPLTKTSTASAVLQYCCVCDALTKDKAGFDAAQAWIRKERLYPDTKNPLKLFVYWLLITNNPMFHIVSGAKIRKMKKERGLE